MNEAKYYAVDIARYVINYSWDIEHPVSNLKLQKLLYLIQGNFLRILDIPCFKDNIEAWKYGPVVPSVYNEFKNYGSNYIGRVDYYYEFERNRFEPVKKKFSLNLREDELKIINDIVFACRTYSSSYLVDLTHKQSPWIKAYQKFDNVISLKLMKEYFCDE